MQYNNQESYKQAQQNQFGWINFAIQGGVALAPFIMNLFSPKGHGEARGLAAIQAKTTEILSSLNQIISAIPTLPANELQKAVQAGKDAVAALSNPTVIYQAQKGADAQVLAQAKEQANGKLNQILQLAQNAASQPATGGQTQTVQLSNGQIVTVPTDDKILGIDKNYLFLGAGALGIYLLLNRK